MGSATDITPLVVIVGETASGKSSLAIELARQFNGEIIAADSRTVYKGMNIGTAKPSASERLVPHHLIDITTIDKPITVAEYKLLAQGAINDVTARGRLPILVGGTGLYIDAVIFNYGFTKPADLSLRTTLESLSTTELQQELTWQGIPQPVNERNRRHLTRQLETQGSKGERSALRQNTLLLGTSNEREIIVDRIDKRTAMMFEQGLLTEARALFRQYGEDSLLSQTIGYQEFIPYIHGQCSLEEVRAKICIATAQYAKRQRTWFRRNKSINYISNKQQAVDLMTTFLNKLPVA